MLSLIETLVRSLTKKPRLLAESGLLFVVMRVSELMLGRLVRVGLFRKLVSLVVWVATQPKLLREE